MVSTTTSFAKYSKTLCWIVSFIWLLLSILAFTGGGENGIVNGLLWLVGAFAFAISAIYLSRNSQPAQTDSPSEHTSEQAPEQVSE